MICLMQESVIVATDLEVTSIFIPVRNTAANRAAIGVCMAVKSYNVDATQATSTWRQHAELHGNAVS